MSIFFETLSLSAAKIMADFNQSKQIWHNASAGIIREKIIQDVLLPYLPECYGLTSGLCYDKEDNESKQLDLIIYDKLYSYRLPFDNNFIVFPCESVFGNIEIKTKLNKDTLQESIDNIASLKKLKRADSTGFDITPQLRLTVNNGTIGTKHNTYTGIVFAYESLSVETILSHLQECDKPEKNEYLPDIFVLFDKQTIIYRADIGENKNINIMLNGSSTGYIPIMTGENTIAHFLMYILTTLYFSSLQSINPGSILFDEIKKVKDIDLSKFIKM